MLDKKFFKIICFIALLLTSVISLSSCANNNQLLLLNWGEYINQELITKFEQEYNAIVNIIAVFQLVLRKAMSCFTQK